MLQEKAIKIGFPRALLYHKYGPMWMHFFRALHCQILTSPNTNRAILDQGLQYSIDENCLAVKIFLGHVQYLIGKVDYIFVPSFNCLHENEEICVKLSALGDIVRNTFKNVQLLDYIVDQSKHQDELSGLTEIGRKLGYNPSQTRQAYDEAVSVLAEHKQAELEKQLVLLTQEPDAKCRILVVAHSYVMHDAILGKLITRFLEEMGTEVIIADVVDEQLARTLSTRLSSDCHWTYSKSLMGGIEFYRNQVDGIVFLMAFPCGPDALIATLCQHMIQDLPLCVLNMDELQGDAGLKTRLESFVDILLLRKEKSL
ncbi:MAG: acyl-CoA dehydratase activase-related protein [Anaerolineae bacterium]